MSEVPLREPTFLILTALAAGAQHGYGIMTDVAEISGGRVRLRAGTLYAALNRLAVEGLIEFDREQIDARLRRYYRLTPPGAQRLAAEVDLADPTPWWPPSGCGCSATRHDQCTTTCRR